MAHTVATMLGSGKGRGPRLQDFVMKWGGGRRQTAEEQLSIFRAMAARMRED